MSGQIAVEIRPRSSEPITTIGHTLLPMILRRTMIVGWVALVLVSCSTSDEATIADSRPTTDATSTPTSEPPPSEPRATVEPATSPAPTTDVPSSDAEDPANSAVPSTSATPTDASSPATTDDDRDLAESALLTSSDYPDGWTEAPFEEDPDESEYDLPSSVAGCLGVSVDIYPSFGDDESLAESGTFTAPDGAGVQQMTVLVEDASVATDAMAQYARPDAPGCYAGAIQEFYDLEVARTADSPDALPAGTSIGDVTVESIDVPVTDDVTVHYLLSIPIVSADESTTVSVDILFFRQGRALSQVQITSGQTRFASSDIDGLSTRVLELLEPVGR